jgi:hypothetical protein
MFEGSGILAWAFLRSYRQALALYVLEVCRHAQQLLTLSWQDHLTIVCLLICRIMDVLIALRHLFSFRAA